MIPRSNTIATNTKKTEEEESLIESEEDAIREFQPFIQGEQFQLLGRVMRSILKTKGVDEERAWALLHRCNLDPEDVKTVLNHYNTRAPAPPADAEPVTKEEEEEDEEEKARARKKIKVPPPAKNSRLHLNKKKKTDSEPSPTSSSSSDERTTHTQPMDEEEEEAGKKKNDAAEEASSNMVITSEA